MKKVQMFNVICCIYFVLISFHRVDCLYLGERCDVDGAPGICKILEECSHVIHMVKSAGMPMPTHIRMKLVHLNCGYHYYEPLVCCTYDEEASTHQFLPHTESRGDTPNHSLTPNNGHNEFIWSTGGGTDSKSETFNKTDGNNSLDSLESKKGDHISQNGVITDIQNHRNLKLLPDTCGTIESDRILGGKRTSLFEMPWMALLSYSTGRRTQTDCGGTLINEYYVLTAAHCVTFLRASRTLSSVILGEYDLEQDPDCEDSYMKKFCAPKVINASIDRVIPHPGYSPDTKFDDIALLRLSERVDLNSPSTRPICLPTTPELQRESLVGQNAKVAGWGITLERITSTVLLSATLPVLDNSACQTAYKKTLQIYDKQICAGGMEDVDSCSGDSGGPLMIPGILGNRGLRYIQRGIISLGSIRCGVKDFPTVYTNLAYYMDWILDNISN